MANPMTSSEGTSPSLFSYESLPRRHRPGAIRLVFLELGCRNDIAMSMHSCDLSNPPEYIALSYTWGDPLAHPYVAKKPSKTVRINKKPFIVTPNLYDALNHLRSLELETRTPKMLLWIDALCINQDDVDERNHQVGLMGQIYSTAALVISWAGIPDENARVAFEVISRIKPFIEIFGSKMFDFALFPGFDEPFGKAGISKIRRDEWQALISFCERQYFSRAWIVQEIVLAKKCFLMVGHCLMKWTDLTSLSGMVTYNKWSPILETCRTEMKIKGHRMPLGAPLRYTAIQKICKQYGPSGLGQLRYSTTHSDTRAFCVLLELLLYEAQCFRATDPRDNVYAVLSIASHVFGVTYATTDLLRPDYRLPVSRVFINATHEIVAKTDSVSIICLVDHDSKQTAGLPSWVPDYGAPIRAVLGRKNKEEPYNAFDLVQRSTKPTIVDDEMFLSALRWDTIADIQSIGDPLALLEQMEFCLRLPNIYPNGQTRVEALWRTLIGDKDRCESPAPVAIGKHFRQYVLLATATIILKILKGQNGRELAKSEFISFVMNSNQNECSSPWLPSRQEFASYWDIVKKVRQNSANYGLLKRIELEAHLYMETLNAISRGRELFKTAGNLLGLAPASAKHGDSVWFFPSSKVPFVPRHRGGTRYELVGEAYLHGYMHGELQSFNLPLQRISLV